MSYNLLRSSTKLLPGLALGGRQGLLMTGDILACAVQQADRSVTTLSVQLLPGPSRQTKIHKGRL